MQQALRIYKKQCYSSDYIVSFVLEGVLKCASAAISKATKTTTIIIIAPQLACIYFPYMEV